MTATRFPMAGGPRLVLVRGGLDDADRDDGGPDWQDFCHRIGWQPPGPAPADDFEERIAERLRAKVSADKVVRIDFARGGDCLVSRDGRDGRDGREGEATEANFGPAGESEPVHTGWGRLGVAVAMSLAVAAAAVLVVGKMDSSNPYAASGSASAELSASAERRSAVAPSVERAAPMSPVVAPDAPDVRGPNGEERTAKPGPSARPPRFSKPRPPGTRVALRSVDAAEADGALVAVRPATPELATAELARSDASPAESHPAERREELDTAPRADADLDAFVATRADRSVAWGTVARDRVVVPVADSVAFAPAPVRASADVWSNRGGATGAAESEQARTASASWSLSPESARWFGATVTPSLPRGLAPASVGAMAQLDLGKALSRF